LRRFSFVLLFLQLSDAYGVMEEQGALLVERYLSGFLAQQQQQQQRK